MTDAIQTIVLNGVELGYGVQGAGPDKPSLIFAHGYALRSTVGPYDELLALLSKNYVVHALDLRGHGASAAAVEDWSFEALADDVAAFAAARRLDAPMFVGHSFGCVIGLLAEIRHPGTFSALCLLSPGPADHRRDPVDTLEFLIEHGRDREAVQGAFGRMFVRPTPRVLDAAVDAVILVDPRVHRAQKEQNPHFSIDDDLGGVAPPILLVCGKDDTVVPPERQHDMAVKLTRSKEVVFSGEGHMLMVERPDVVVREMLAFLNSDATPTRRASALTP